MQLKDDTSRLGIRSCIIMNLRMTVQSLSFYTSCCRLYWTPAPPKMNLAPATIKSQLYPDYHGASLLQESLGTDLHTVTGLDSDDNDETEADLDDEDLKARNR